MQVNEDKFMLIESMKKLTTHISNNSKRQLDIFASLSLPDLEKIVYNLHDNNENLRRISALLLCELAYRNNEIKKKIAVMLKMYPAEGRICLGGFPNLIVRFPHAIKNCLELIKMGVEQNDGQKFCWIINLDKKISKIQYLQFKTYNINTFIDPNRTIFGFIIPSQKKYQRISPLKDKNYCNLIMPLRSIQTPKSNELNKTFRSKEKQKNRLGGFQSKRQRYYGNHNLSINNTQQ